MSDLLAQQQKFVRMLAQLLTWAGQQPGYELTVGEAYRTPAQAALDAKAGTGISNSLHTLKLAMDLALFIDGVYQAGTPAYEPMGKFWESLGGSWGGRFVTNPDGNHFSLSWQGIR